MKAHLTMRSSWPFSCVSSYWSAVSACPAMPPPKGVAEAWYGDVELR